MEENLLYPLNSAHGPPDSPVFAPLGDAPPLRALQRHPSDPYVVMAAFPPHGQQAAIWHLQTGQLVAAPTGAIALAWLPDGARLAMIRASEDRSMLCEVVTWPDLQRIAQCPLALAPGQPVDLVISPRGDLAACTWMDEGSAGVEFLTITADAVTQIEDAGYEVSTDVITRSVFSPSGRYMAFGAQDRVVWWADAYDQPAAGGEYEVGWITILDWQEHEFRSVVLDEVVANGWLPDPESATVMLADPIFIDEDHLRVSLPTGSARTFSPRPQ